LWGALLFLAATFHIPDFARYLMFLALLVPFTLLILKLFSPCPKPRKRAVVWLVIFALLFWAAAVVAHRQYSLAHVRATYSQIARLVTPMKVVDPTSQRWFSPTGEALLFYTHPASNVWSFYQGAAGCYDPDLGIPVNPVTPAVRREWQAEATAANQRQAAELAPQQEASQQADSVREQALAEAREADHGASAQQLARQAVAEKQEADEQRRKAECDAGTRRIPQPRVYQQRADGCSAAAVNQTAVSQQAAVITPGYYGVYPVYYYPVRTYYTYPRYPYYVSYSRYSYVPFTTFYRVASHAEVATGPVGVFVRCYPYAPHSLR
jgi:hypothetical protein